MFGYDDRQKEGEPLGISGLPAGGLFVALNRGYKRYAVTIIYPYLFPPSYPERLARLAVNERAKNRPYEFLGVKFQLSASIVSVLENAGGVHQLG